MSATLDYNWWFAAYYWLAFFASWYWAAKIPTKMSPCDNAIGTTMVAMFGFVLWPLFLVAYLIRPTPKEK